MAEADDARACELAARVEREYPRWLVVWGAYSQEYCAFARFDVPRGIIMHAADPHELVRQLREIELRVMGSPGAMS